MEDQTLKELLLFRSDYEDYYFCFLRHKKFREDQPLAILLKEYENIMENEDIKVYCGIILLLNNDLKIEMEDKC